MKLLHQPTFKQYILAIFIWIVAWGIITIPLFGLVGCDMSLRPLWLVYFILVLRVFPLNLKYVILFFTDIKPYGLSVAFMAFVLSSIYEREDIGNVNGCRMDDYYIFENEQK